MTQKEIIDEFKRFLKSLTPEKRLDVMDDIGSEYCGYCGGDNPDCQCWNDE